ncbi:MAG: glycosyltransferase [Magnetococcus sp. DMHC-6]
MSSRLRILHITTQLLPHGGIEENLRLLAQRLDPNHFELFLCPIRNTLAEIPASFINLPIHLLPLNRAGSLYDIFTTIALWRLIRNIKPHIVHTHNNKGNFHGRLAARWYSRTAIVTTHHDLGDWRAATGHPLKWRGLTADENWLDHLIYPILNLRMNRLNHGIIVVSQAVGHLHSHPGRGLYLLPAPYDDHLFVPFSLPTSSTFWCHSARHGRWSFMDDATTTRLFARSARSGIFNRGNDS